MVIGMEDRHFLSHQHILICVTSANGDTPYQHAKNTGKPHSVQLYIIFIKNMYRLLTNSEVKSTERNKQSEMIDKSLPAYEKLDDITIDRSAP